MQFLSSPQFTVPGTSNSMVVEASAGSYYGQGSMSLAAPNNRVRSREVYEQATSLVNPKSMGGWDTKTMHY